MSNVLTIDDLDGNGLKGAKKFFVPQPIFILTGCSNGKTDGIAQKLSVNYEDAVVIASDKNSCFKKINANYEDGHLSLNVVVKSYDWFKKDFGKTYRNGAVIE